LTSYLEALRRLGSGGTALSLDVLAPPYPCAGRGTLRVVRVSGAGSDKLDPYRLVVTYDDFVRLA